MIASILIASWNRSASLAKTLDTLTGIRVPSGASWEIIVVDNNSSDDTKAVCLHRTAALPLRYTFDPVPGKWAALNRVIPSSRGGLLAFTDDDVDVDPGWLAALFDAAARFPDVGFLGGRVVPRWETPPPRWLAERAETELRGLAVACNFGPAERVISSADGVFLGANMAFRRELFEAGWRFPEALGPRGRVRYPGGETRLMSDLLSSGMTGLWVPDAVIHHRNEAERSTEAYLRRWYSGEGRSLVVDGTLANVTPTWWGVPRYLIRRWAKSAATYAATRWLASSHVWLPAEIEMARSIGAIGEFWRRRHGQGQ